ncbi:MAG TPA: heavy metal translocating P-type ATPase, partial [Firmicutes bacterium]|nr:heavy metal translocating P-type ATPase [Bacillota bacterium]
AFDKTGTLTLGQPQVASVTGFELEEERVLSLAAAAELRSEHHLATAILSAAEKRQIEPAPADDWTIEAGLGVVAHGPDGEILVGNRRLLLSRGTDLTPEQAALMVEHEEAGETVAIIALNGQAIGLIGITDPIKPDAFGLVKALKRTGIKTTVMLTGDNPRAAQLVVLQ